MSPALLARAGTSSPLAYGTRASTGTICRAHCVPDQLAAGLPGAPTPWWALTKAPPVLDRMGERAAQGSSRSILLKTVMRGFSRSQLVQDALDGQLLAQEVWIGGIDHLEQQVRAQHFVQRGTEGVDQVVRQLVDESDRIGHHHTLAGG